MTRPTAKLPDAADGPQDTRATAALPGMTIDILHRRAADGQSEAVSVTLTATPDFKSALPMLDRSGMPALAMLWAQPWLTVVETMWGPWMRAAGLPSPSQMMRRLGGPADGKAEGRAEDDGA
ncbi:MAG TPA: hypothetical protein VEH84_00900 [Alphaproteobacteria bacterium]|nr:hypothetical protein [Alphaproteobacteria bacterium]